MSAIKQLMLTTHTYTVSGTEFDETTTGDNCNVASVINDFNNTETINGTVLPEGITTIIWTVTDDSGNQETCSFDILVNAYPLRVNTISENEISIFPNPTNGLITIETKTNALTVLQIKITDLNGKVVYDSFSEKGHKKIDLSLYDSGVYLVEIISEDMVYYKKVILQ